MARGVPSVGGAVSSSSEDPIVFVVDDDPDMRDALNGLFTQVGLRVEACVSAIGFLGRQLPEAPSCIVVDIRMPRLSGFDLQAELARKGVSIPIIFITSHGDIPMSVQAMKAGAIDFLTKPFRDQEILDAVNRAIERDLKRRSEEKSNAELRARFESLTPRERQIMALITGGLMNKQVAGKIGVSEMTVKIHRGSVMRKMQVKSLADLVIIAEALGIRGRALP
jgi:FixJ family two-component response regulator